MFYSFYGSYTKLSMIFESTQDLLHKFKHSAFLNKKGKRKTHWSRGRPAWLRPKPARALGPRGLRALPPPLTRTLTGGSRPSVPSSSSRRTAPAIAQRR
jgi:hypothetical protein